MAQKIELHKISQDWIEFIEYCYVDIQFVKETTQHSISFAEQADWVDFCYEGLGIEF